MIVYLARILFDQFINKWEYNIVNMTYFDYIRNFWAKHNFCQFSTTEIALYFYLLECANTQKWPDTFVCVNKKVEGTLGVSYRTITAAKEKLRKAELIDFLTKNGSKTTTFSLTFGKFAKVSTEVSAEVSTGKLSTSANIAKLSSEVSAEVSLAHNIVPVKEDIKTKDNIENNIIPPIPPKGDFLKEKKLQEKEAALKLLEEELCKREDELKLPTSIEPETTVELEFERFRKEYPGNKRGFKVEFDNFKKKHRDYRITAFMLYPALMKLKEWRDLKKGMGQFVPEYANLQTWINQRRWEVELEKIETHENIRHTDGAKAREQQTDRAIMEYAAKAFGKDLFGDS
nr:MAG TPA: hypothetical protein [Caudoviricetes sp.]